MSSPPFSECLHGGQLRAAAQHYRIPLAKWLDLSTGINPVGWPVPPIPPEVWQRLPEDDDGLMMACMVYSNGAPIMPVAGSQAAIQTLPQLYGPSRVGVLSPCYAEHGRAWQAAGHSVTHFSYAEAERAVSESEIVVLTNPNNPTGCTIAPNVLLDWQRQLAARGGLLVVDEAFITATPELSIMAQANRPGLVVLRSLGKFWGLAGVRCGFVVAELSLLSQLEERLGPWAVSHPARWIAQRALSDRSWQAATTERLTQDSARLAALLDSHGLHSPSGCVLFRWVPTPRAVELFEAFARRGVLVRAFPGCEGLRFGLPGSEADWEKLETVLQEIMR